MAVAGAAGAGVMAVQDRSLGRGIDDSAISSSVKTRLLAYDSAAFARVDVEVAEAQVLLSGTTGSDQNRLDAERIAWGVKGVEAVANQINVGRNKGLFGSTHDEWITARVRAKLVGDAAVKGLNFNIETHDGVVYLMGLARSDGEMRRAAEIASFVGGVKRVVSYMQVRAAPPSQTMAHTGAAPIEMAGASSAHSANGDLTGAMEPPGAKAY
jgi:osmotically-inducible protein OsmY